MMNKLNKNSHGFIFLEIIILFLGIGIIGFVSWYVWSSKTKADRSLTAAAATELATGKVSAQADVYADWKIYKSAAAGYSIKYPPDWSLRNSTNSSGAETAYVTSADGFEVELLSFDKTSQYGLQILRDDPTNECNLPNCLKSTDLKNLRIPGFGTGKVTARTQVSGNDKSNVLVVTTNSGSGYIKSGKIAGIYTIVAGEYQNDTQTQADFARSSSVKTAILMYQTLKY
jgi:hypothetical protein